MYLMWVCGRERRDLGFDPTHTLECAQKGCVGLWGRLRKGGAFTGGEGVVKEDAYCSCIEGGVVWW